MFKRTAVIVGILVVTCFVPVASSFASTLWYNGDFNFADGLANEINTWVTQANVYDDFIVGGTGWTVNSLWSNNLMNFAGVTQALWEIRSGVSNGNGGTVIASGTTSASQTATGRSAFGYDEYTILVSGLNLTLNPGTYWLTVAPIGVGAELDRSFNSTTSGLNAVGTPTGNNLNAFFDSSYFGYTFYPTTWTSGSMTDFSMGIAGSVIPEPATMSLLGMGLLGLFGLKRKKT